MKAELRALIQRAAERKVVLHGFYTNGQGGQEPWMDRVYSRLGAYAKMTPEQESKAVELVKRALNGSDDARTQLNGIRVQEVNNFIYPSANFLPFFEIVNLGPADRPVIQNTTKLEMHVGYMSQHGKPNSVKLEHETDEATVALQRLTTDDVWYFTQDIYRGDITAPLRGTYDLAFDMKNQKEANAFDLLTATLANGGAFGAFDFTDPKKVKHVFKPHSRVRVANLPTTNDILVPGSGPATKFRFAVFAAIVGYGAQWADAFVDGPIKPTGDVIISSLDVTHLADEIIPSGSTNNKVADQLLERGWAMVDYLGNQFRLIADNTLEPGVCYPRYNKPVGWIYGKPSMDQDAIATTEADRRKAIERRYLTQVFGIAIPSPWRLRVARFRYRTAAV